MWRVRSSSLSARVFSCFLMTSASYSATDAQATSPTCRWLAHLLRVDVEARLRVRRAARRARTKLGEVLRAPARRPRRRARRCPRAGRSPGARRAGSCPGCPAARARASARVDDVVGGRGHADRVVARAGRRARNGMERWPCGSPLAVRPSVVADRDRPGTARRGQGGQERWRRRVRGGRRSSVRRGRREPRKAPGQPQSLSSLPATARPQWTQILVRPPTSALWPPA